MSLALAPTWLRQALPRSLKASKYQMIDHLRTTHRKAVAGELSAKRLHTQQGDVREPEQASRQRWGMLRGAMGDVRLI